ncbi:MAG: hypothetical protein P8J32_02620, partial [bacterium]|nr:hypothetical protein [bacterium]
GICLALIGGVVLYRNEDFMGIPLIHGLIAIVLILNGLFLSFKVSPFMLQKEREGKSSELLPRSWQRKIAVSLVFSDLGWWGALFLLAIYLVG